MGTQDNAVTKWVRVAQVVVAIVAATAIPWCAWFTTQIHSMQVSIAKLEEFAKAGDRFTASDGERLRLEIQAQSSADLAKVWKEMSNIQARWLKEISAMNTQIALLPQTIIIPPKWWEDYVRTELAKIEIRVSKLEDK